MIAVLTALGTAYLALLLYKWVAPDDRRPFWKPIRMTLLLTGASWGLVVAVVTARSRAWRSDQSLVTVSEEPYPEDAVRAAQACIDTLPKNPVLAYKCKYDIGERKKPLRMVRFKICNHSRKTVGFVRWRAGLRQKGRSTVRSMQWKAGVLTDFETDRIIQPDSCTIEERLGLSLMVRLAARSFEDSLVQEVDSVGFVSTR